MWKTTLKTEILEKGRGPHDTSMERTEEILFGYGMDFARGQIKQQNKVL